MWRRVCWVQKVIRAASLEAYTAMMSAEANGLLPTAGGLGDEDLWALANIVSLLGLKCKCEQHTAIQQCWSRKIRFRAEGISRNSGMEFLMADDVKPLAAASAIVDAGRKAVFAKEGRGKIGSIGIHPLGWAPRAPHLLDVPYGGCTP